MEGDSRMMGIRRYSTGYLVENNEIEHVEVAPSTELIPDEYEHKDNKTGLVIAFCGNYPSAMEDKSQLIEALAQQGYNIPEENLFKIVSKKNVLEDMRSSEYLAMVQF